MANGRKKHFEPRTISEEAQQMAGEERGFIRIVFHENGPIVDGDFNDLALVGGLVIIMKMAPEFERALKEAVALFTLGQNNPGAAAYAVEAYHIGVNDDCNCPKCRARKEEEKIQQMQYKLSTKFEA